MSKKTIEKLKCKNCGKNWGGHIGNRCTEGDGYFDPFGDLNKICTSCGEPLKNHISHLTCPYRHLSSFTYDDEYIDNYQFLPKELFNL